MAKVKIYIVDIEEDLITRLDEIFYENPHLGIKVIGYAHNQEKCMEDLDRARKADVYLVSAFLPDQMGIDLIPHLKRLNPKAKVITMVQKNTRNLAEISKEKGGDDFIQKPFKGQLLVDKIYSLIDMTQFENDEFAFEDTPEYAEDTFSLPVQPHTQEDELFYEEPSASPVSHSSFLTAPSAAGNYETEELSAGRGEVPVGEKPNVVAVFSATGSYGKTTILANVAAAIQKHSVYQPKICILDFNLLFPSVLYQFHDDDLEESKRDIYGICEDMNYLNEEIIKEALVNHTPTGIKILLTPPETIRNFNRINAESIEQLLHYLREMFDLILIDTSSNIREDTTSFPLTVADKGIVLMEPDLSSLLHTRKFINMMKVFETNLDDKILPKLTFVLNKENPKAGIHIEVARRTIFNTEIPIQIPEDITITQKSNSGNFIVDTNSPAAQSIRELANMIYPLQAQSKKKKNFTGSSNQSKKSLKGLFKFGKK